jgi:hypothetical protein
MSKDFITTIEVDIFSNDYPADIILKSLDKENYFVSFCEKLKKLSSDSNMRIIKSYKDMSANNVLNTVLQTFNQNKNVLSIKDIANLANLK